MKRFHDSDETTVRPINLRSPGVPREANTGTAGLECGQYALGFAPTPEQPHLSVFTPDGLNRSRLGNEGRALYQADFYLPAEGAATPNTSLLAQVIDNPGRGYKFYRFGILEDGERVFFTFANDTEQPEIFENQQISELNLRRPAWHRFQIIFYGRDKIFCSIDGQMTSFSPITEGTHQSLNAGIMVSSTKFNSNAVADNLSIQWTPSQAPLPVSPWVKVPENASIPNTTPLESGKSVFWLNDHNKAWETVRLQQRPLLVMFYSPNIGPYQYTKKVVPNNEEAYALFNKYVLLKFDANQLKGGKMAEKFNVRRIPTMIILDPKTGREMNRFTVINRKTTWNEIKNQL